ncbi:MAG TPA: dTDP-4-dehydrorhamnose reductase [Acidimicrobiales bacterium]|nr:dTDP-4-dehydrorhamnose reductase [Acidimicrobiales bacterium]
MKVLVTGAGGQLGTDLTRLLEGQPHHQVVGATRAMLDVEDRDQVMSAVTSLSPQLIIHAAAWTAVDACESDPDHAWRANALACRYVAEGAAATGAHLVVVSTDYVFDGTAAHPYTEWDQTNPLSIYGRSKLGGENEIRALLPGATIARTSWVCGANGSNMVKTLLRLAASGTSPLRFVDDQRGCPTFTEDLASMLARLGIARLPGTFHVTNQGSTSWFGFAQEVLRAAGLDPSRVEPITTDQLDPPRPARRPANAVLDNTALRLSGIPLLPDYREPLERTVKTLLAS